jgi:hypothetical protein
MSTCRNVATGGQVRLTKSSKNAATKAASRFYDNDDVGLLDLAAPLLERAHEAVKKHCQTYALCVHDVSPLHYTKHPSKTDRRVMYSQHDLGYELQTALLISDRDGAPLAPACMNLAASDGVHSTRRETLLPYRPWIDEINRTMGYIEAKQFKFRLVHIIDREADKLLHLRRFDRCQRLFVIRANDSRRLKHEGQSRLLLEVEATLGSQFKFSREIEYKGKKAYQYVAETRVVLNEPGRIYRQRQGKLIQRNIPGRPLELRLVIAQVRDKKGNVHCALVLLALENRVVLQTAQARRTARRAVATRERLADRQTSVDCGASLCSDLVLDER